MYYGRVIGTVVATRKDSKLTGKRLLVVEKVNCLGEPEGGMVVAVDHVSAGMGDMVFIAKGKDAVYPMEGRDAPVEAGIMGIIDYVHMGKE